MDDYQGESFDPPAGVIRADLLWRPSAFACVGVKLPPMLQTSTVPFLPLSSNVARMSDAKSGLASVPLKTCSIVVISSDGLYSTDFRIYVV